MLTAAAVVACALSMLGRSPDSTVPIRFLDAPPHYASQNVEAFVMRNPDTIYMITSTAAFRDGFRGPGESGFTDACLKIASIIVHEEWHLRYGDDEEGAYLAQVMTLMRLNAAPTMISGVRRSMTIAVAAQRSRAKAEFVAARR
jgi:hypothetical protein